MKTQKQEIVIPLDKIGGQRFGQLLYNALIHQLDLPAHVSADREVGNHLHFIDSEDLVTALEDYLSNLKT